MFFSKPAAMVRPEDALPGRAQPLPTSEHHYMSGIPLKSPVPDGMEEAMFGMGCFWGVERRFWQVPGVWLTMVGYAGGFTPNPTYRETCTQLTGHNEVVRVIFDPKTVSYADLLKVFWESHDPTQGMRQGNDVGSTYRSGIYAYTPEQQALAEKTKAEFEAGLKSAGFGKVTTEITPAPEFFFAEEEHQQYLAKNPNGYCSMRGTGVTCAI